MSLFWQCMVVAAETRPCQATKQCILLGIARIATSNALSDMLKENHHSL